MPEVSGFQPQARRTQKNYSALPLFDGNTFNKTKPLSPKRPLAETNGLADVFPYYAGFSFDWACAKLRELSSGDPGRIILDPWNGAGTTTQAALYDGNPTIGIDLNPVATLVAQLRCTAGKQAAASVVPRDYVSASIPNDPLSHWFDSGTVSRIRDWTAFLIDSEWGKHTLGMVSIFRVVRALTKQFEGTNPTWVKAAQSDEKKLALAPDDLDRMITEEQEFLLGRLSFDPGGDGSAQLITASAHQMPLADNSVDVILTSPPYLTRIDYAVAYARELAVLGIDALKGRELRSSLMGTTLIRPSRLEETSLGTVASDLICRVSAHPSKASSGYYLKQVKQYLDDLCISLDEISRVAKNGASFCMVVQDSFYKDEHVPLAEICEDEAGRRGWIFDSLIAYPVIRSLTSLNKEAQKYQKSQVEESVMTFRRPEH